MDMNSPVNVVHDNIISKLESNFSESLRMQEAQELDIVSERNVIDNCDMKCLKECSTFPYSDIMLPSSSSDEEAVTSHIEKSPRQSYLCSISLPAVPKLVSAMKGSREKQGGSEMKLTVKWAPDVYDPFPTILSHTVKSKKNHKSGIKKSEKRNGKKGQKMNYSKRVSGKDKQNRNKWLHSRDEVFESSTEFDELDVIHDSYCGTRCI